MRSSRKSLKIPHSTGNVQRTPDKHRSHVFKKVFGFVDIRKKTFNKTCECEASPKHFEQKRPWCAKNELSTIMMMGFAVRTLWKMGVLRVMKIVSEQRSCVCASERSHVECHVNYPFLYTNI